MPTIEDELRTSASLLLAVRDPTDGPAWAAFVARYEGPIRRWCRCKGLGPEAEDAVTQRVLVKLLGRMRTFDYEARRGAFRDWLRKVVVNEVMDEYRGRRRRPGDYGVGGDDVLKFLRDPDEAGALTALVEAEEQVAKDHRLRKALERVRHRVGDRTWRAFWLTTVEECKGSDVAERLGMAVGAVFVAKSRTLTMIREELGHLGGRPGEGDRYA
jgi:RNA polymerase sigma-70 factor (ECF subfamily)